MRDLEGQRLLILLRGGKSDDIGVIRIIRLIRRENWIGHNRQRSDGTIRRAHIRAPIQHLLAHGRHIAGDLPQLVGRRVTMAA
jgi:hypothetical protein